MKKYDFIFVVLVYRNTADLKDFFKNLSVKDSKTIVVNSFYDEDSEIEFNTIAKQYNADFISVPNKGYGAGNNTGIKHALDNYDFKYLVISNADIIVNALTLESLKESAINAPNITNLSGRMQNPMQPYELSLLDWVKYNSFKKNKGMLPIYICIAINKIARIIFRLIHNGGGISIVVMDHSLSSRAKCFPSYTLFTMKNNSCLGKRIIWHICPNQKMSGSTITPKSGSCIRRMVA